MRKYGYLVVEGPHDVEFAYRLLKPFSLERVQHQDKLDEFFLPLIPREYPPKGDLQKRMPTPLFLQSETHAVAIHSAEGDSQLINLIVDNVNPNVDILDLTKIVGIGILLDSDKEPSQRYLKIKTDLAEKLSQLALSDEKGVVKKGQPNLGAFVLPNNQDKGTLENLLLESAELVYPDLLKCAKAYLDCAKTNANLTSSDLKKLKNAGENKAIIGAMSNIFRPSKSAATFIQDKDLLDEKYLPLLPKIQAVQTFLKTLFELQSIQ
jgi:hypothetical protein